MNLTEQKILYDFSTFGKTTFELANKTFNPKNKKEKESKEENKEESKNINNNSTSDFKLEKLEDFNFDQLEKIDTKINGPFDINEWLSYLNKNYSEDEIKLFDKLSTKQNILTDYPRFESIIEEVLIFKQNNKKIYKYRHKITEKVPKKKQISKFGLAKTKPKDKVTDMDKNDVFIESPDSWRKNSNKNLVPKKNVNRSNGKFKLFKVSDKIKENASNMKSFKNSGYKPPGASSSNNGHSSLYSLVIKNIPEDYSDNEMSNNLKKIFSEFGKINRVKVLKDYNTNKLRGIAFIDFNSKSSIESILNSQERFKIGHNILQIEKKNN